MRKLNDKIVSAIENGSLSGFLDLVEKSKGELELEIRNNYVNIYYMGGCIYKIVSRKAGCEVIFNKKYFEHNEKLSKKLRDKKNELLKEKPIDELKEVMRSWFVEHPNLERQCQQKIVSENNWCEHSDYTILDIEYAKYEKEGRYRFDMIAINSEGNLSLIELKYGLGSVNGNAGILKHIDDIMKFLNSEYYKKDFYSEMEGIMEQKKKWRIAPSANEKPFSKKAKAEIILLFINDGKQSDCEFKKEIKEILKVELKDKETGRIKVGLLSQDEYMLKAKNIVSLKDFSKQK